MMYLKNQLKFKRLLIKVLNETATDQEWAEFDSMLQTGKYYRYLTSDQLAQVAERSRNQDNALANELADNAHEKMLSMLDLEKPTIPLYRSKLWLAAAAVIVLAMIAGVWFIANEKAWYNSNLAEQTPDNWATYSGKQVITLPDGSKVTLNTNSTLKHGRSFGKTNRTVTLAGEAAFDVTHDASKPFLVETGKVTTRVLGTEFNVTAYPEMAEVTVTVVRGLVEVRGEQRIYGQIKPNEQIAVNTKTDEFVQQKTNAQEAVQWRSNFLVLDNVSLEEAAKIIGEKFNVQIEFENEALKKCRYFGSFLNNENLNDILTSLSIAMRIEFELDKRTNVVTLRGKGCE